MAMRVPVPEPCFLNLPAAITPELARSCPDKMNVLFQVQLIGRSLSDPEASFRLLMDLMQDLVPYDRGVLLWEEDFDGQLQVRTSRGFDTQAPLAGHRERLVPDDARQWGRPFLLSEEACAHPPLLALLAEQQCTSLLSLPLYVGERPRGLLQLVRRDPPPIRVEEAHLARVFTLAFEGVLEGLGEKGKARELAYLDHTTGLFNRRYFEQQLEREFDRARRNSDPVSVLFFELGGIEAFRNRVGHATTEGLLHDVTRCLRRVCRKSDTLARYADDRFGAILPRTPKASLGIVAQRVFEGLEALSQADALGPEIEFSLCALAYPDDAFSADSAVDAGWEGTAKARALPGRHYYQFPSPVPEDRDEEILDSARTELLRGTSAEGTGLVRLFTRLALDVVPADRVSLMVRDGDAFVVQVALGFNGQEEVIRTARIPLSRRTISAWVAQSREPLLVESLGLRDDLPSIGGASYRGDSFFSYPLCRGDEVLGVMHFSNRSDGQPFTQADVDRFAPVAQFIGAHLSLTRDFGAAHEEFLRESLFALVDLTEKQVPGMEGHSLQVAQLARSAARAMGYAETDADRLWTSARLHDLGKVSYRTNILAEPRALSPRERALTQRHPLLSWKFLEGLPLRNLDRDAILYHHEREDGSGYLHKPAEDIPAAAKILAAADVYQALVSSRPYRPAVSSGEALTYLRSHKGTLFDSKVVEAIEGVVLAETPHPERVAPSAM